MKRSLQVPLSLSFALLAFAGCDDNSMRPIRLTFDACAPLAVVPDGELTGDQERGVRAGIEMWNLLAGTRLSLMTMTAMTAMTAAPAPLAQVLLRFQRAAAAFHGLYDDDNGVVWINSDLVDRPLQVTAAHELGHAFGLYHVDPALRPSVMNSGNLQVEPTAADADKLAEAWGRCSNP